MAASLPDPAQELALLRALARSTRGGAWQLDLASQRLTWTRELFALHEVDPAQFEPTLERAIAFFPPQAQAEVSQSVQLAREQHRPWDLELPLVTARGRRIWVRMTGTPQPDTGPCTQLVGTLAEISDERRARDALRLRSRENRKLAAVAETTRNAVIISDVSNRIEWVNAGFTQLTGYRLMEVVGQRPSELLALSDTADAQRLDYAAGRDAADAAPVELRLYRKDRQPFWCEVELRPVRDEDGAVTHVICVLADTTARRIAEEARQLLADRLQMIALGAGVGLFERDLATDTAHWDATLYATLGLDPQMPPPPLAALDQRIVAEDRARFRAFWQQLCTRPGMHSVEFRFRHPDGRLLHLYQRSRAEFDANGRARRVVGVLIDISERREAQEQARAAGDWLRVAVDSTGIGLYGQDPGGEALQWDAQMRRLTGVPPQAPPLSQDEVAARVHPDDRAGFLAARAQSMRRAAGVVDVEFRWQRMDGAWRRFRSRRTWHRDSTTGQERLVGVLLDLTAEHERDAARQRLTEQFALLGEAAGIGLWEIDLATEQEVWDAHTRSLYGLAADETPPDRPTWREKFLHPDDRDRVLAAGSRFLAEQGAYEAEYRIRRRDGAVRWLHSRAVFSRTPGEADRVVGISIDVTERREAEAAARAAQEWLQVAVHATGTGLYRRPLDDDRAVWDAGMRRICGYTPDEPTPDLAEVIERVHPDDRPAYLRAREALIADGRLVETEFRWRRPDDEWRYLRSRSVRVAASATEPAHVVGVIIDITDQRKHVAEQQRLTQQLALIEQAAGIGLWEADLATGELRWDAGTRRIYRLADDLPAPTRDTWRRQYLHPDDLAQIEDASRALQSSAGPYALDHRIIAGDGSVQWVHTRGVLLHGPDGTAERGVGIVMDISARKRAEGEVQALSRHLKVTTRGAGVGTFWRELPSMDGHWDAQTWRLFGLTPRPGAPTWDELLAAVHPADRQHYQELLLGRMDPAGAAADVEARVVHPDGSVHWVLVRGHVEPRTPDGRQRLSGVVLDVTEGRAATAALRDALDRLAVATDGAGIGIYVRDDSSGEGHWEPQTFTLFGLTPQPGAPTREEILACIHPEDRAAYIAATAPAHAWDRPREVEVRVDDGAGGSRWLLIRGQPLTEQARGERRRAGVVIDITAQKRAEQRATRAVHWLELAGDTFQLGFWRREIDSGDIEWSAQLKRIFGLAADAPTPAFDDYLQMIVPEDRARMVSLRDAPPAAGQRVEIEYRIQRPDGQVRHLLSRRTVEADAQGRPQTLFGAALDVTDIRVTAHHLRAALERIELVTSGAGIGYFERRLDAQPAFWSDQMWALYRRAPQAQAPAWSVLCTWIHPDDRTRFEQQWRRMSASEQPVDHEYRVLRGDGSEGWLLTRARREDVEGTGEARVVGVAIDITDRKRAEARAAEADQLLGLATHAVGIGFSFLDLTTLQGHWDRRSREIFGLPLDGPAPTIEEFLARIAPEHRDRVSAQHLQPPRPGQSEEVSYDVLLPGGERRHVLSRRAAQHGADGRPLRLYAGILDVTASQRAGMALNEAQLRLQLAAETAGIASWERNLATGEGRWDRALYDIYGLPSDEPVPPFDRLLPRIHPDDLPQVLAAWQQLRTSERTIEWECRITHTDGRLRHLATRARCEQRDGQPYRFIGATMDVTAAREASTALREAMQRLQLVSESAGIGYWERDLLTGEGFWDRTRFDISGLPPQARAPTRAEAAALYHPEDRALIEAAWARMQATDEVQEYVFRTTRADGELRLFRSRGRAQRDASGRTVRLLGITMDVTEVHAAGERLRSAQERLQLVGETGGIGSWEEDLITGEMRWDPVVFSLFGLSGPQAPTRAAMLERVHPDDRQHLEQAHQRRLQATHAVEAEFRVQRTGGSWAVLNSRAIAQRDDAGRPVRMLGTLIDVTASRSALQRLREADDWLALAGGATGIGFFHHSADGLARSNDRQMHLMHGLDPDHADASNEDFARHVLPEDQPIIRSARERALNSTSTIEAEYRIMHPTLGVRHILTRRIAHRAPDGRVEGVVGAALDVTNSRRAEQALRDAQRRMEDLLQRMQLAADAAGLGFWESDLVNGVYRWDVRMYQHFGLAPGDTPPSPEQVLDLIHPDDRGRYRQQRAGQLDRDGMVETEFRVVRPDGSVAHLVSRGRVLRNAGGQPVGALGTLADVSAVHAASRELRAAHEALQLAGTATGIGFFRLGLDDSTLACDHQTLRIYGLDPAGPVPTRDTFLQAVVPEDRPRILEARARSASSEGPFEVEYRVRHPDGSLHHVFTRRQRLIDDSGTPYVVGAAIDVTASRSAQQALAELSERIQLASETAGLGIWDWYPPRNVSVWNDRMYELFGTTREAFADRTWAEVVHPEDRARAQATLLRAAHEGSSFYIEFRVIHADGSEHWLASRGRGELDAGGAPLRVSGVNYDITERRRAEETLRESETRFRSLFEDVPNVAVQGFDGHGTILYWNAASEGIYGFRADEVLGRNLLDLIIAPADRESARLAIAAMAETGRPHPPGEYRLIGRDGKPVVVLSSYVVVARASGEPEIYSLDVDLSARKLAEQELRTAEAQARDLVQRMQLTTSATGIGMWEVDTATGTIRWDAQMYRLYGRAQTEPLDIQQNWQTAIHPDDWPHVAATIERLQQGTSGTEIEFRIRLPDGGTRHLANRVLQRTLPDGTTQLLGVTWDATDRALAESTLRAKELAERANQAKSEFLSRMSHELRTPLNAILGFTQILDLDPNDPLTPSQRERLSQIAKAGWHLLELINEVLDLARIEAGKSVLSMEAVPLTELIDECLTLISTDADRRRLTIEQQEAPGAPATVWADRTRLKQVLLNLLSNAVKYNRDGGTVTLQLAGTTSGEARITVRDTGAGLTAEQRTQLFQPFNRLGRDDGAVQGTGIGLTIAQKLIEQMGGRITVESTPGVGSAFTVTLNAATAASAPAADILAALGSHAAQSRSDVRGSVLYVEDNPDNVVVVEQMLRLRPGISLLKAADGASARVLAAVCQPDLMLIDMRLPDTDGVSLLHELRATPATAQIPCVAVSANALPADVARARQAGFHDYWTKPLDAQAFLRGLDALLAPASAHRSTQAGQ